MFKHRGNILHVWQKHWSNKRAIGARQNKRQGGYQLQEKQRAM